MKTMIMTLGLLFTMSVAVDAYEIDWSTLDSGGGTSGAAGYVLSGTIAQPDAGVPLTGQGYELIGGFWAVGASQQQPMPQPGDCDGDDDVDLLDFGDFQLCFTGMDGGPIPGNCECADFDGDGDVDLLDFGQFSLAYTG
jgi:hypothetical protein